MPSLSETTLAFPLIPTLMMELHCLIGLVAARTGYHRGGDLGQWLLWGILGGTVALITARYGDRLPFKRLSPQRVQY